MQLDLRAVDRRKEILTEKRRQRERDSDDREKPGDEDAAARITRSSDSAR